MKSTERPRVLIVEDSDSKFAALEALLEEVWDGALFKDRAATVIEAEAKLESEYWSAVILDISMNITKSAAGPGQGGHATLGGLNIAKKMYLLDRSVPTIIVTAFDTFETAGEERGKYEVLGLEDVERRAKDTLGEILVGCVRYGDNNWKDSLINFLKKVI